MLWLLFVPERNMWWFRGVFAVSTHDRDVSTFGAWLSTRVARAFHGASGGCQRLVHAREANGRAVLARLSPGDRYDKRRPDTRQRLLLVTSYGWERPARPITADITVSG
jgi:hypothetical protein